MLASSLQLRSVSNREGLTAAFLDDGKSANLIQKYGATSFPNVGGGVILET